MRAKEECYPCLENLARKTASLLTVKDRENALQKGLDYLKAAFSSDCITTHLAARMQDIMRREADCRDPFQEIKKKEMALARTLSEEHMPASGAGLRELIAFAAKGNSLDFFLDLQQLHKEMQENVTFLYDDIEPFQALLARSSQKNGSFNILYLADNAGECYFDLPLVQALGRYGRVFYGVKESPVQNDLTIEDLRNSGIREEFDRVISTGTDTPGLELSSASSRFLELWEKTDLIVAKGMGHYETLPELSLPAPAFLILKAKCRPVARSIGVPLKSFAAILLT